METFLIVCMGRKCEGIRVLLTNSKRRRFMIKFPHNALSWAISFFSNENYLKLIGAF